MQESGRGLSGATQRKCHHSWNEVPANEGLSPLLFFSFSMRLRRGATGNRLHWWGHPRLGTASALWPLLAPGDLWF